MFPSIGQHYGEILLLTSVVGSAAFLLGARREGLPIGRVVLLLAGLTVAAHLGGRFHLLAENDRLLEATRWFSVAQGYRQPGALLGLAIAMLALPPLLLPGVPIALLGDLVAISTALGLAVARFGCLAAGCCFGTVCALPWAISFPPGSRASALQFAAGLLPSPNAPSLPVHPLQVYFLLLSLGVALLLLHRRRQQSYNGELLLLFLAVHESGKFLLEFFRFTLPGHSSAVLVQSASLLLAAIGIAGLTLMHLRRRGAARSAAGTMPAARHASVS